MRTKLTGFRLRLLQAYVRRRLRKAFADLRVHGLDELQAARRESGAILCVNHVSWWDPMVMCALDPLLDGSGYALMDGDALRRWPFFGWAGAVAVDRGHGPEALRGSLARAAAICGEPGRVLAVFASGTQRPAHLPLLYRPGILTIQDEAQVPIVPAALRYDFIQGPRAVVHLFCGSAIPALKGGSRGARLRVLESRTNQLLGAIDQEVLRASEAQTQQTAPERGVSLWGKAEHLGPEISGPGRWLARRQRGAS